MQNCVKYLRVEARLSLIIGTFCLMCMMIDVTYGLWSPTCSTLCHGIWEGGRQWRDRRFSIRDYTKVSVKICVRLCVCGTLLIAVRAGSQAASRSWTSSWILFEITLRAYKSKWLTPSKDPLHKKALFYKDKENLLTYVLNVSISPVKLILSTSTLSTFSFSFSSSWNANKYTKP